MNNQITVIKLVFSCIVKMQKADALSPSEKNYKKSYANDKKESYLFCYWLYMIRKIKEIRHYWFWLRIVEILHVKMGFLEILGRIQRKEFTNEIFFFQSSYRICTSVEHLLNNHHLIEHSCWYGCFCYSKNLSHSKVHGEYRFPLRQTVMPNIKESESFAACNLEL